ncbi:MAG: aspartyl protease family protein [Bacteroidota bacterium]
MGLVYADITLVNYADTVLESIGQLKKKEIRRIVVSMLVDSGAYMMAINETIQAQLGLKTIDKRKAELSNGSVVEFDVVGPLKVLFKNRMATANALVLPGNTEPILGAIPMEEMDVLIHPNRKELVVNPEHPIMAQLKMK